MSKLLLSCVMVLGAGFLARAEEPQRTTSNKSIDGTWTVLCAEKDGQPLAEAKDITVTVKDNVFNVRCKDGKEMSLKMEFTGPGQAKMTEENAPTTNTDAIKKSQGPKEAVYVLTNDFLSICVHHDKNTGDIKPASATDETGRASSKSYCSFVLKRTDSEPK
ncbi:hypothetical protein [Limnoglobus roseus]|uniref:TIGR03067 domain-containing protein n=1 Tax=Limnoglobus roseus TaxID=2598579 RepID=A0A5C1AM30_9BACT|nr:hypothetical protein [Limnoglobus roseus]QEL19223.1 TIGR03067 domain-containing protein [Limnoglobus roseus]